MRVALISNDNGRGLSRDTEIVGGLAHRAGHEVVFANYQQADPGLRADLAIMMETAPAWALHVAPRRWGIFNPEWFPQQIPIGQFERVLCKTREGLRVFSALTDRAELVGFTTRDRLDESVPRERRFLHVAGKSVMKATDALIAAWEIHRIPHPLTIVSHERRRPPISSVVYRDWLTDDELQHEQNRHLFYLAPSWTEGYGHSMHEALSCGAVVARSEWAPMSESPGAPIAAHPGPPMRAASTCRVTPDAIRDAVQLCWSMDEAEIARRRAEARRSFEGERTDFEARMLSLFSAVALAA